MAALILSMMFIWVRRQELEFAIWALHFHDSIFLHHFGSINNICIRMTFSQMIQHIFEWCCMFAIFQHTTKCFVFANAFVQRFVKIAMGCRLQVIMELYKFPRCVNDDVTWLWRSYRITYSIWKPTWVSSSTTSISSPIEIVKSVRSPISPGFDAGLGEKVNRKLTKVFSC